MLASALSLAKSAATCCNSAMHPVSDQQASKWRQHLTLQLPQGRSGAIWVHACSVGEVGSVAPLIRTLLDQGHAIHLTVVTATGYAHARRLLGDQITLAFLPWDLPFAMGRMIRALKPTMLLLAETEFWPGMLSVCKRVQIPVIGINTRISDRSFPRYRATRMLWQRWLAPVSLFLPQSEIDAERLIAMGVAPDKVRVAGNLKYAVQPPKVDCDALRRHIDPDGRRPLLMIASTHSGEDERLLAMLPAWQQRCPELLTLIVPRHPERFDQVAELIANRGHHLLRWSGLQKSDQQVAGADIILIDAMGVLTDLYTIADLVIIAGSLANIGGHNPLEAAICGRGVVTGPYVQNFRDIMDTMQREEAAIVCADDDEIASAIDHLLQYPDELKALHGHAALFIQDRAHVLDRILAAIEPWLPEPA